MKKQLKRMISILLTFSMCVLLLAGCGTPSSGDNESGGSNPGKTPGKTDDNRAEGIILNKDVIYKSSPFELEVPVDDIGDVVISGDTMYIAGYTYDEETWASTFYIFSGNADGSEIKTIYEYDEGSDKYPAEDPEIVDGEPVYTGQNIQNMAGDGQGNLIEVVETWTMTSDEYLTEVHLVKMDSDGNELWDVAVSDVSWINSMCCCGGKILILSDNIIYVFDDNGAPVNRIEITGEFWINNMVGLEDGSVYVTYYDYSTEMGRYVLAPVDFENGKLGELIETSWGSQGFNMIPGIGYDIFLQNSSVIAGYNLGDENYTELLNFVDSDIDTANMCFISPSGEGRFLMGAYDEETWDVELFLLTKVDPADVKDKVIITLGMMWTDYELNKEVIKFNKNNDEYRIKIITYNTYNTDANPEGGVTQLNNDITAGKMPDILITDGYYMPVDSYISKGAFEDLNTWLDNDPELNREDYMPNVLEAFSVDGKLYQVTPSFAINTLVGKASIVGDTPGWTIDDVLKLAEQYPDSELFSMWTRDEVLINCMSHVGYQFMNEREGTCSFDSEDFIKLLEWAKTFPEEIDYSVFEEDYWMDYDSQYREDKVLLMSTYLSSFSDFKYMRGATFGEKVTYIGYPTSEGTGGILQPETTFAMSAQSVNKEGAWQFIRYFLTEEYQTSDSIWCFPVMISALEAMGAEAMKPYTYIGEGGEEVVVEDSYWVGDKEVIIDPLTQEEIDGYIEYMKTVDRVYSLNDDVINIITEDAAIFFAGQKTAADVAAVIQSRAKIYLAENQ